jgi:hypothetical protein
MKRSSLQAKEVGISFEGYSLTMLAKLPITSLPVVFKTHFLKSPLERWLLSFV